ncbi:MAG TPA: hypothetical protein VMD08_11975 [Candidatus Baltobacteraceae bacterium]|nr:hypothetical protein [Candidatus Baltobacteraceae bacterium]
MFRLPVSTATLAVIGLGAPLTIVRASAGSWREALDAVAETLTLS